MAYDPEREFSGGFLQINIRIGAGAVLMSALLVAGAWYAHDRGLLPNFRTSFEAITGQSTRTPEFIPTNGGVLTIAWVKGYETFVKRSPSEWNLGPMTIWLPFGETVSEISTAARYQYQIRLAKRWAVDCSAAACVVRTGAVELADPVAIDHQETVRKTESGWARFDKAANLEALNMALGPALVQRGNLPRNRSVGLRDGRAEIEKFVRNWMLKESLHDRQVIVLYPGEQLVDGKPVAAVPPDH
ncbi:MAG: hypothetical protein NVS3B2_10790 [Ramlibacter sp.]